LSTETDSIDVYQSLVFRFTYGITNKFEAGMMIASDLSSFSLGAKYSLFTINDFSGGIIAGGTFAKEVILLQLIPEYLVKHYPLPPVLFFLMSFSKKVFLSIFDAQYQCFKR